MIRKTHAEKPKPRYSQRGENIFKKEGLTLLQIHTSVFVTVNVNSVKQLTSFPRTRGKSPLHLALHGRYMRYIHLKKM